MKRPLILLSVCLYFLLATSVTGCKEQVEGYVYVDNGAEDLITVYVDSQQEARIGPGRCRRLTLPLGNREFRVERNGEVVYEKTLHLDSGNRPYRRPAYVLNPDRNHRYCDVRVDYDDASGSQHDLGNLISMLSQSVAESETRAENEDPASASELEREYKDLTRRLVPMGDSEFFAIDDVANVFKPLPTVLYSRRRNETSRRALTRVPRVLHDYLSDAVAVREPTVAELERLKVAEDVTLSYVAFRN